MGNAGGEGAIQDDGFVHMSLEVKQYLLKFNCARRRLARRPENAATENNPAAAGIGRFCIPVCMYSIYTLNEGK